jgi:hypothetical protein
LKAGKSMSGAGMTLVRSSPTATLRRIWPVVALLLLVLFPFGWLGEVWPAFGALTGLIFATAREHAAGHTALFLVLGTTLLLVVPALRSRPAAYCLLMLLAGIAQEAFQLAYKQRPLAFDDGRDLVTDLAGALLALALVWGCRWRQTIHSARPPDVHKQY